MRHNHRSPQRPVFEGLRPDGPTWTYEWSQTISSAGYVIYSSVLARRLSNDGQLLGRASCQVTLHDDPIDVLQFLAVEAMLAACEPTLFEELPHRHVIYQPT